MTVLDFYGCLMLPGLGEKLVLQALGLRVFLDGPDDLRQGAGAARNPCARGSVDGVF